MMSLLNWKTLLGPTIKVCFILSTLFLNGCTHSTPSARRSAISNSAHSQISKLPAAQNIFAKEPWTDKFFKELLLESPIIYTIFGDKPMSGHTITYSSFDDYMRFAETFIIKEPTEKHESLRKKYIKSWQEDDLLKNWKKWMQIKNSYPNRSILFLEHVSKYDPSTYLVDVINIREMTWTLYKHYQTFKKELGYDFDPIKVTLEFEDPESKFWNGVFLNNLLTGIAYGFGERNSYFFSEEMRWDKKTGEKAGSMPIFAGLMPKEYDSFYKYYTDGKLEHMQLPMFRSYIVASGEEPVLSHYKSERARIQKLLKGKNLAKEALNKIILPRDKAAGAS